MRGGAVAARVAHNHEVVGSNPTPATRKTVSANGGCRFTNTGGGARFERECQWHSQARQPEHGEAERRVTTPGLIRGSKVESHPRYTVRIGLQPLQSDFAIRLLRLSPDILPRSDRKRARCAAHPFRSVNDRELAPLPREYSRLCNFSVGVGCKYE